MDAIERFLKPFDCWSMRSYGLYDSAAHGKATLAMIDDETKAKALLRLLDLTASSEENAVVPFYLGDALEQVRNVVPILVESREYRRLATAARRREHSLALSAGAMRILHICGVDAL